MHSWHGGGGDFDDNDGRQQQWQERGVDSAEDDDKDPNGDNAVDNDDLIF